MRRILDIGTPIWILFVGIGTLLLGIAIAYGIIADRKAHHSPEIERQRDEAVRELYHKR
jgi:hypothetical protein